MTNQSVPLSSLLPPAANPRSKYDAGAIDGLAASIRADGLLQNLVVVPCGGSKRRYRIISGERRYRALKLLQERGDIDASFKVRVEIRSNLAKDDILRLATVENLQREDLPPLDQAAALGSLIRNGATFDDLVAKTGLSATTIRRRLALSGLCDEAAAALREGVITLAQAEALTLGTHETQADLLERIAHSPDDYSASAIRDNLLDEKPSVAMAIFPREQYTGTITTDLFQADEESVFDDAEQFLELQKRAVEELARRYESNAAWVEVTDSYRIPGWQYEKATKRNRKKAGVVINLSPRGAVEVREGLIRPERMDRHTAAETAESPLAPAKTKAVYPAPLRRTIAWHKTLAVQEVLLSDARKAKEVAAVHALLALKPHEALVHLARAAQPQVSYEVLETQAAVAVRLLGLEPSDGIPAWQALTSMTGFDAVALYRQIATLSDAALDQLHTVLAVLPFGQLVCERLDAGESLFNAVASDLKVDMRNHWRPDDDFLNRRTREQLVAIARECGYEDGLSRLHTWKKGELVQGLLRHFASARQAQQPTDAQRKALTWLPEAMLFPAVDPDADASRIDAAEEPDADGLDGEGDVPFNVDDEVAAAAE